MPDNIKVIARFRPENDAEKASGSRIVSFDSDQTCTITAGDFNGSFTLDRVFDTSCSQGDLFDYSLKQTVDDLMNGYNGTVLAYGQTGSGKSHTMMGPDIDNPVTRGAIPRMVDKIFDKILRSAGDIEYTVRVSYMEIYMERIKDLLNPQNANLSIHQDKTRGVYVKGLTEEYVASSQEVYQVMRQGARVRATASTNMNQESSRSHSIFTLVVSQRNVALGGSQKTGQLFLVDLAGSEKVGKTGASGQTLEEAKKINKSLSALGMVINSLTDGKSTHVPYRDSKLTRILQESLGGNSRTSLIVNCSPSSLNDHETISTLRFGVRAKTIRNKAKVNTELSPGELRQMLRQYKAQLAAQNAYTSKLEAELNLLRDGSSIAGSVATDTGISHGISTPRTTTPDPRAMSPVRTPSWSPTWLEDEDGDEGTRQELQRFTEENQELKLQVDRLLYEQQEMTIRMQILSQENSTVKEQLGTVSSELENTQKQLKEAQEQGVNDETGNSTSAEDNEKDDTNSIVNASLMESVIAGLKVTDSLEDKDAAHQLRQLFKNIQSSRPLKELQDILSQGRQEFDSLVSQDGNDAYKAQVTAHESTISKLMKRIEELEADMKLRDASSGQDEQVKKSLMRDLQDRCERIVELEISLDKVQEQYNLALRNSAQQKRVALLQRNLEQLTRVQKQLVDQNTSLKTEVATAQKFLDSRNERIRHLESALLDSQQALRREHENFEAKIGLLGTQIKELRRRGGSGPTAQDDQQDDLVPEEEEDGDVATRLSARIVKPLRGGSNMIWEKINRVVSTQ
uniref:Kinesin-like protein n=1 Tax=Blastobotrys adeninivorans TaxID=409370 RepID=A0A060T922_BLAAD